MDFVYEKDLTRICQTGARQNRQGAYTRDDVGFAFFSPLADFSVDLVAELGLYLPSVAWNEINEVKARK